MSEHVSENPDHDELEDETHQEEIDPSRRKRRHVVDNVHGIIRLTSLEYAIASGFLFNRLHYVYQLSTAFLTWPTARTQRYEHSLGTMHVAGLMFSNSLANASSIRGDKTVEQFATVFSRAMDGLLAAEFLDRFPFCQTTLTGSSYLMHSALTFIEWCKMGQDIPDCLVDYANLVPASVPPGAQLTCVCLAQGVRLAGMLHDLGHPPLSHICESVLEEIQKRYNDGRYKSIDEVTHLSERIDELLLREVKEKIHEAISVMLADLTLSRALERELDECKELPESGFLVVSTLVALAILADYDDFEYLHYLVAGTIDADRLDFVQRDGKACNVGSEFLQYGRVIEGIRLVVKSEDASRVMSCNGDLPKASDFVFAFPEKTLQAAEELLRGRFTEYKEVVHHHHVMKSDQLIRSILLDLADEYIKAGPNGSGSGVVKQQSFDLILPDNVSGLWKPIIAGTGAKADPRSAELLWGQWTDSWLLAMLRNQYTRLEYKKLVGGVGSLVPKERTQLSQLSELFFADKAYESVVKRGGDCRGFRLALLNKLTALGNEPAEHFVRDAEGTLAEWLPKVAKKKSDAGESQTPESKGAHDDKVSGDSFVTALYDLVSCKNPDRLIWLFRDCYDTLRLFGPSKELPTAYEDFMGDAIHKKLPISSDDLIVVKNSLSLGITGQGAAYFFNERGALFALNESSTEHEALSHERDGMPTIYAYVRVRGEAEKDVKLVRRCHDPAFFETLADYTCFFVRGIAGLLPRAIQQ